MSLLTLFSEASRAQEAATTAIYMSVDAGERTRLAFAAAEATDVMIHVISESERTGEAFTHQYSEWLHRAELQLPRWSRAGSAGINATVASARYRLMQAVVGSPAACATLTGCEERSAETHRFVVDHACAPLRAELFEMQAERAELLGLLAEAADGAPTVTVTLPAAAAFADLLDALRFAPGSAEYKDAETAWKARLGCK